MALRAHVNARTRVKMRIAGYAPVDGRGDDAAALMVLMIARDFCPAGDADAIVIDGSRRLMVLR